MRTKTINWLAGATLAAAALPFSALADSISPESFSATLGVGESVTITKTVTVDSGIPTSSKVDVFFLADETGSMGSAINAVKASASDILSSVSGAGDIAFGVGGYRDIYDSFTYHTITDLTTDTAAVDTAIGDWSASGGGDYYEAGLYGLESVAETTSWRDGSERILVWFGDAPSHDPRAGSTEASATDALVAAGVEVEAISVGSGGLDGEGQASRITAATGGTYFDGIASSDIVDTILAAITTAISEYSTVGIDISDAPDGVSVDVTPAAGYSGDFDRSETRTFDFDVTFTGDTEGTYAFDLYGTVDGGRVATEVDSITVAGASGVPEPSSLLLMGLGLTGLGAVRRRKQKA